MLAPGPDVQGEVQYETSREAFLGRGRSPAQPAALDRGQRLSGTVGAVLDPDFRLRCAVIVRPHESATLAFTTAVATSREEALSLADQYHDCGGVQRAFELAWAFNQVELRHLHLSPAKAHLYQRLASPLAVSRSGTRGPASESARQSSGAKRACGAYGISGDLPIMLVRVTEPEQIDVVRELLAAHALSGDCTGLGVDLCVLNDYPGSYFDALQDATRGLASMSCSTSSVTRPQRVSCCAARRLPAEDQVLLEAAAAVVLHVASGLAVAGNSKLPPSIASEVDPHTASRPAPQSGRAKAGDCQSGCQSCGDRRDSSSSETLVLEWSRRLCAGTGANTASL